MKLLQTIPKGVLKLWEYSMARSIVRVHYLSHLFNIVFLVAVPCYSICRKMHFVAGGPNSVFFFSLCCHCTNSVQCTHINLKIVCPVSLCLCTPSSISPVLIQPAIVWIINTIVVCACRHSGIWYFVPILHTNRSTFWKTNKKNKQTNKQTKKKAIERTIVLLRTNILIKCRPGHQLNKLLITNVLSSISILSLIQHFLQIL